MIPFHSCFSIDNYRLLKNSGAIDRENERWPEIQIDFENEYEFIIDWIKHRLDYLDEYFD